MNDSEKVIQPTYNFTAIKERVLRTQFKPDGTSEVHC